MADNERRPNQTVSDPGTEDFKPLPRDMSQPIHRKPRVFIHRPSEDPDEEERARKNTSVLDAARTIQLDDFQRVHKTPCFRDAVMPAIGMGGGVGALRFVVGGSVSKALNFSMGTFVVVAVGGYQWCQSRRRKDKEGIRQAVKVLDEKQALKSAQAAALEKKAELEKQAPGQGKQSTNFWSTFKFW